MTGTTALITVVSVTYQSASLVSAFAVTLRRFAHVVVVDNASQDGTVALLREQVPGAQVIARARNAGFGAANNEAMAQVQTPYALLINPDCSIAAADVVALLATLERYGSAGVVAPQSWLANGEPQMSFRQPFYEPRLRQPYRVPDGTVCAKWLHGCCLLVRVDAFRAIGGFDPRFFLYYEDDDLCLRLQQAGHECLFEPAARAEHAGGASSTPSWRVSLRKHFHYARSRRLAIEKYVGIMAARRYRCKIAIIAPLATLGYSLLLQPRHALKWAAWGSFAWGIPIVKD